MKTTEEITDNLLLEIIGILESEKTTARKHREVRNEILAVLTERQAEAEKLRAALEICANALRSERNQMSDQEWLEYPFSPEALKAAETALA